MLASVACCTGALVESAIARQHFSSVLWFGVAASCSDISDADWLSMLKKVSQSCCCSVRVMVDALRFSSNLCYRPHAQFLAAMLASDRL
jgi:hypothetical protein